MSLWCGACRKVIQDGFVILYRLERDSGGNLLFPDKEGREYVPPNSAICENCLKAVPESEKTADVKSIDKGSEQIFAIAQAGSTSMFGGAKNWSGIETDDQSLVFVKSEVAQRLLPSAIEIIEGMAA